MTQPTPPSGPPPRRGEHRAAAFLRQASEPLFLLDSRRRLVFANSAWETYTGLPLEEVRGRPLRRRSTSAGDPVESLLRALAPPVEVVQGETGRCRRVLHTVGGKGVWTDISYFPWHGKNGLEAIMGRLRPLQPVAVPQGPLPEKLLALRDRRRFDLESLASANPAMRLLIERMRLAAATCRPAFLHGEAGTGKRWCARVLFGMSSRRDRFLACLDARRLPVSAIGPLLFPGATMSGLSLGGIYLASVEYLPLDLQFRLAQSLSDPDGSENSHRPWVLLGSRHGPESLVRSGRLSEDLFCAVGSIVLEIPPLRERLRDLPSLVERLLSHAAPAEQTQALSLTPAALEILRQHSWPGNLAELFRVLSDACRHAPGDRIDADDLPHRLRADPGSPEPRLPLDELLEEAEKRLLTLALRLAQGNKARACEILGIWRPRFLRRLEALGLEKSEGS